MTHVLTCDSVWVYVGELHGQSLLEVPNDNANVVYLTLVRIWLPNLREDAEVLVGKVNEKGRGTLRHIRHRAVVDA